MNCRFVFSGGPGSGKTTVLLALEKIGFLHVSEVARALIRDRIGAGLTPRPSPAQFASDILKRDISNFENTIVTTYPVFFDRGVVDALCMLQHAGELSLSARQAFLAQYRYNKTVFLCPPWREIYCTDAVRDQSFSDAVQVFSQLRSWYAHCGYTPFELPRSTVEDRVACVLERIRNQTD